FDADARTVVENVFDLPGAQLEAFFHAGQEGFAEFILTVRCDKIPGKAAGHLLRRTLEQGAHGLVEAADDAVAAGFFVRDGSLVGEVAVAALAFAELALALA